MVHIDKKKKVKNDQDKSADLASRLTQFEDVLMTTHESEVPPKEEKKVKEKKDDGGSVKLLKHSI